VGSSDRLNVSPELLTGACEQLSGAARGLLDELKSLDSDVSGMLSGWQGCAGGDYGRAWTQWQQGAREVESALSTMAGLLGEAATAYAHRERRSAEGLGRLGRG